MTEDEILAERAKFYARVEDIPTLAESRCLEVTLEGRRWLFPEHEIALLISEARACELPPGVRWCGLPCCGLIQHGLSALPLVCWGKLAANLDLPWRMRQDILLLRVAPIALRVPPPVTMGHSTLSEVRADALPWSRGVLADGARIADLSRLAGGPG